MAFPTPSDFTLSSSASGLSHSMTLPGGTQVGDTLVAVVAASGATVSTPAGWILRGSGANTSRLYVFSRVADGTEGGTLTITTSLNNGVSMIACRVPDAGVGLEVSAPSTGSSTTPDSPSLTPSWGSADTLWFTCFTATASVVSAGLPVGYTDGKTKAGTQVNVVAWRQNTTATEDPGAFTAGSSQAWVALTFAIQPSVVAPPANAPTLVGLQAKSGSAVDATVIDRSTTETQFVLESAPDVALTGTVTTDGTTAALVGVSTLFTTELAAGTRLRIGADPATYQVSSITDDTHATLTAIPPAAQAAVAASKPGTFDAASPVATNASTTTASTGTAYTLSATSLAAGTRLWLQARSKNSGGTGPASAAQHIITTAAGTSSPGNLESTEMLVPSGVDTVVTVTVRDLSNNFVTDAAGLVPKVSVGGAIAIDAQHALVAGDTAFGEYALTIDGALEANADGVTLVYRSPDASRWFKMTVQAYQGVTVNAGGEVNLADDQSTVTIGTVNDLATAPTNFSSLAITGAGAVTAGTVSDKTGYGLSTAERTSIASSVWGNATRSLTTFGTLVSDVVSGVWGAGARTLTAFSDSAGVTTLLARLTAARAALLDFLDAAISTRLAGSTYTAPDNAGIASANATLATVQADAAAARAAAEGASTFDPATDTVLANVKQVNNVPLIGDGVTTPIGAA